MGYRAVSAMKSPRLPERRGRPRSFTNAAGAIAADERSSDPPLSATDAVHGLRHARLPPHRARHAIGNQGIRPIVRKPWRTEPVHCQSRGRRAVRTASLADPYSAERQPELIPSLRLRIIRHGSRMMEG